MNIKYALIALIAVSTSALADTDEQAAELSNKLANPLASLISVPIEYNIDSDIGPSEDGEITSLKFSPVLPFSLNDDWNLITRAVFSYVDQDAPEVGLTESGWNDAVLQLFFSPKAPTKNGWIWGAGTALLLDTASEDALGSGRYGVGPSAVALKQIGPWTLGALTNYVIDAGGDSDRDDIEIFFVQPFLNYTFSNGSTSATLNSEYTRDLENYETSAFATATVNQIFKVGSQLFQARVGVRHWYDSPEFGPDSTELSLRLTLMFPK